MKKQILVFLLLLTTLHVFADREMKVPRRVFFELNIKADVSHYPAVQKNLLGGLGELLYTNISSIQPISKAEDKTKSHNQILIKVQYSSETQIVQIDCTLLEKTQVLAAKTLYWKKDSEELSRVSEYINETAALFTPYLTFIKPEVDITQFSEETQLQQAAAESEYQAGLDKLFELTFWFSGITVAPALSAQSGSNQIAPLDLFPIITDFTWFFNSNIVLYFSVYLNLDMGAWSDQGSTFVFSRDINDNKGNSNNFFFLPGLGITYRTLDFFAAQFSFCLYSGFAYVKALEDLYQNGELTNLWLSKGESKFVYILLIDLSSALVWNFSPNFNFKLGIHFHMNIVQTFMRDKSLEVEMYNGALYFHFFSLGAAYKF